MADKKCAPSSNFYGGSCIPLSALVVMAKAYNEDNNDKIDLYKNLNTLHPHRYKKYLVNEFGKRLSNVCTNQSCWVKQRFVKKLKSTMREELEKHTFRPKGPAGSFKWLNTININEVMGQYEKKYKDFLFLGAVPIDFDELDFTLVENKEANFTKPLKDVKLEELESMGKTKLGIIFNLDEHNKRGSHWVGMFANLKEGDVFFFDSYGVEPEIRIRKFMNRVAKHIKTKGRKVNADHNNTRHQQENSECGVYSMHFITSLLQGKTFDDMTSIRIPDSQVSKMRQLFFIDEKGKDTHH